MARVLTVVTMALALGGCGLHYWSRPDASLDTFNRESAACAKEATTSGALDRDRYRDCLKGKGWIRAQHQPPIPAGWYRGIE